MPKNLEVKDLIKSIEYVTKSTSSSENYSTFKEEPIFILVYNEIKKFTKEELEGCQEKTRWESLFSLAVKNPFLLSAFIEQGAFIDKLKPESQWIIEQKNKNNLNESIYETIFYIEEDSRRKNRGHVNESAADRNQRNKLLYFLFDYAPNQTTLKLLNNYYNDFGKNNPQEVIDFVLFNYSQTDSLTNEACNFFITKLGIDGININTPKTLERMNNFLPKNEDLRFFISSSTIPKINNLLKLGFKFNEEIYEFKADNLFMAIVKSEREDIIKNLLPYLTNIQPKFWSLETQTEMINQGNFSSDIKDLTKFIQTTYNKLLLEHVLPNNNKNDNKKVKI